MTSTMDQFAANGFEPILVEGRRIHPYVVLDVAAGDVVRLSWESSSPLREQGLMFRLRNPSVPGKKGYAGSLRVDDVESPAIRVWASTSPPIVEFEVVTLDGGGVLRVSNCWQLSGGRVDEWLNNYGIYVEEDSVDTFRLTCSDGFGSELTLGDLVVRIEHLRNRHVPTPM